jgi:hypothetical protein
MMRLINVHTHEFEEFWGKAPPAYGILSHTWGTEEVSFEEWKNRASISHKAGFRKVSKVAQLTKSFDLDYVWIDTNCIDKTSSAELSEAINSMFAWYSKAECCFVHLDDVASVENPTPGRRSGGYTLKSLQDARWFTRGWTLQELIAPARLIFLSKQWQIIGNLKKVSPLRNEWTREQLEHWFHTSVGQIEVIQEEILSDISHITGITRASLLRDGDYENETIAVRMHWASRRITTRVEDMAYCLLGLFKINMPLLYGEGRAAFQRLQEQIMMVSVDQSIFAWSFESLDIENDLGHISLMAPWPSAFTNQYIVKTKTSRRAPVDSVYTLTNFGLSIQLPLLVSLDQRHYIAVLECTDSRLPRCTGTRLSTPERSPFYRLCIPLSKSENHDNTYRRVTSHQYPVALRMENVPPLQWLHIPRLGRPDPPDICLSCRPRLGGSPDYVFLLFVAADNPASYVHPLKVTNDHEFCSDCNRLLFERPSSLPESTQVSVALSFEYETAARIRSTTFVLNARINFGEHRDFLHYDFIHDKASFWSHIPGHRAENMHGYAEVGLMGIHMCEQRKPRDIPIFLNFGEIAEVSAGRQTSKTVVFRRAEDAGGFGSAQKELVTRRGLDLCREGP